MEFTDLPRGVYEHKTPSPSRVLQGLDLYPTIETSPILIQGSKKERAAGGVNGKDRKIQQKIEELRHGFGFLEESDQFRSELEQGINKIYGSSMKVTVVLDPEINAFTWRDENQIFINEGLINEMANYFGQHGKTLSLDHLLFILGHEVQHHDDQAATTNLMELYCDIESAKAMAKSGYNPNAALDAMEFLKYVSNSSFGLTHPGSDFRLTELRKMLSNSNYFTPNKEKPYTKIDERHIVALGEKINRAEKSLTIWRETDTDVLLKMLDTEDDLSFAVEIGQRVIDLQIAEVGVNIAKDPRFANLVLFYATLGELNKKSFASSVGKKRRYITDDFSLAKAFSTVIENKSTFQTLDEIITTLEAQAQRDFATISSTPEQYRYEDFGQKQHLLQEILQGNFTDPSGILLCTSSEAQSFAQEQIFFNGFFTNAVDKLDHIHTMNAPIPISQRQNPYIPDIDIPDLPYDGDQRYTIAKIDANLSPDQLREKALQRSQILPIILPVYGIELLRDSLEDKMFVEATQLPQFSQKTVGVNERITTAITRIIETRYSHEKPMARQYIQEVICSALSVIPSHPTFDVSTFSDGDRSSLLSMLKDIHLYPLHGNTDYEAAADILDITRQRYKFIGDNHARLQAPLLESLSLVELLDYQLSQLPVVSGWRLQSSNATGNLFLSKFISEADSNQLVQALELTGNSPEIFGLLLYNKVLAPDQKFTIITDALASGKLGRDDVLSLLEGVSFYHTYMDVHSFGGEIIDKEAMWEWYQKLLPLTTTFEDRAGSPFENVWEEINERFSQEPIDLRLIRCFKMGGIVFPFKVSMDLNDWISYVTHREQAKIRLTNSDVLQLRALDDNTLKNLSQTLLHIVDSQRDRFDSGINDSLDSLVFQISAIKRLRIDPDGIIKDHIPLIDTTVDFDSTLHWIDTELPQCGLTDFFIQEALKGHHLDHDVSVIERVLPLLSPIEGPNQTSKNSAIDNSVGKSVVTEFNADQYDLFTTTTVANKVKVDLVEILLQEQLEFWQSESVGATAKLERIDQLIPESCKYKDVIVRRILMQEWQRIEQIDAYSPDLVTERGTLKTIIDARFGNILDGEVRMVVGYMGLQLEKTLHPDLFGAFGSGREAILRYMPDFSYRRDQVIVELLNTTVTSTAEISEALELMLSNNYRSDRLDSSIARGGAEVAGVYLREKLNQHERGEFIVWLLNPDITPTTIQGAIDAGRLDSRYTRYFTQLTELYPDDYIAVANTGLPRTLEEDLSSSMVKKHLLSSRNMFLAMNDIERREFLFDFLTGDKGLFSEGADPDSLRGFLGEFSGLMFRGITDIPPIKIQMLKDIFIESFMALSPKMRTNTFLQIMDIFVESKGKIKSGPQLMKGILQAYGVVGVKLGQILSEQRYLLPEAYRIELRDLKDHVKTASKTFTLQVMEDDGMLEKYQTIGGLLGSASIKQVYEVISPSGEILVGKFIRPQAETSITEGFYAIEQALEFIQEHYGPNSGIPQEEQILLPRNLIPRLRQLVEQEINLGNEAFNTMYMHDEITHRPHRQRQRGRFSIAVPEIRDAGKRSVFETRAQGLSLSEIERERSRGEDALSGVSSEEISKTIVAEWLWQTFHVGRAHGDLHAANVFFSEGTMTMIDWGLTTSTTSRQMRGDFLQLLLAFNSQRPQVLGRIINRYSSDAPQNVAYVLQQELRGLTKADGLHRILELISGYSPDTHLIEFIKSLISVEPYLESLSINTLERLIRPYALQYMPVNVFEALKYKFGKN